MPVFTSNKSFFKKRDIKWSPEKCRKNNEELISSIKKNWPEMRIQLALSRPALREDRILSDKATWLDSTPSHPVSKFDSLSPLTSEEKSKAEQIYVENLSEVALDQLTSEELKDRLYNGFPTLLSGERGFTSRDQARLRESLKDFRREAKDSYFQIISEMPVLGYLKKGNPNEEEIDKALSKIEDELGDFLAELKNPKVDMGMLLPFKSLVEGLLSENKSYCMTAERARVEVAQKENLGEGLFMGASVSAAIPCFITGPVWASVCLIAVAGVGGVGVNIAYQAREESFSRALTGKEFETMAELSEKDRELFLRKLFFSLIAWGLIPTSKTLTPTISKAFRQLGRRGSSKTSVSTPKGLKNQGQIGASIVKEEDAGLLEMIKEILVRNSTYSSLRVTEQINKIYSDQGNPKHVTEPQIRRIMEEAGLLNPIQESQ